MIEQKRNNFLRPAMFLLAITLFFWGIIVAKNFLYPIVFGALFSYLLYPLVEFMEKHKIPRILSILISLIFAISVIGITFYFFYTQLSIMFQDFDALKRNANNNIETLQFNLKQAFGVQDNTFEDFLKEQVNSLLKNADAMIAKVFSITTGALLKIIILPVYIFLFLFYRTKFAYFILKSVKAKYKVTAIKILRDISTVAARYMGGVSVVVLILCVVNSAGLLIIGLKYAILFGIISAFFNFIPYFGTLMGGAVPILFSLIATDDPIYFSIRVLLFFIVVQFTENNILTPNIVGGKVNISPVFIIIGLVLGATVWGIPGMLVIVPFLAVLRIIFKNIKKLNPYAYLLGVEGTEKYGIKFSNINKFFSKNK